MSTRHQENPSCPECRQVGKPVSQRTVSSLVRPEKLDLVQPAAAYRFCASPGCSTVYYAADPVSVIGADELRVRVGQKRPGPPTPVCYCFGHTEEEIAEEIRSTGTSTIPARIQARIQAGECACETENPQGSCCLGNVRAAVKRAAGAARAEEPRPWNAAGWSQAGLLVTAVLASACCWLPLLLIGFGATAVGVSSFFEQYRPYFAGLTVLLLGAAFYFSYRRRPGSLVAGTSVTESSGASVSTSACCPVDETGKRPPVNRLNRILLWPVSLVALAFLFFPNYIGALMGGERMESASLDAPSLLFEPEADAGLGLEELRPLAQELARLDSVSSAEVLPPGDRIRVVLASGADASGPASIEGRLGEHGAQGRLSPLQLQEFQVEGMTCAACASKVSDALLGLEGVGGVAVDSETGSTRILAKEDPDLLRRAAAAVEAIGFQLGEAAVAPAAGFAPGDLGCCASEEGE